MRRPVTSRGWTTWHSSARPVRMDISSEAEVATAIDTILAEVGAVDVLVNNAGFGLYGAVEDVSI